MQGVYFGKWFYFKITKRKSLQVSDTSTNLEIFKINTQ